MTSMAQALAQGMGQSSTQAPPSHGKIPTYVQVDALVILKIVKHCQESHSTVSGQLLGLNVDTCLEISNCFPIPNVEDIDGQDAESFKYQYQIDMMRQLREVNVDSHSVGWYRSTFLGPPAQQTFAFNAAIVDTQFVYQDQIEQSVCLLYDPLRTAKGTLCLRALRLTQKFMDLYRASDFSHIAIRQANLSYNDIFEELPIKISNSSLMQVLLHEVDRQITDTYEELDMTTMPFLEKSLELLVGSMDQYTRDQNYFQQHVRSYMKVQQQVTQFIQKKRADATARGEDPESAIDEEEIMQKFQIPEPKNRLEALLISSQVSQYCRQIQQFASTSFARLFLSELLQKDGSASVEGGSAPAAVSAANPGQN
eukprot:Clim_evm48s201 gene=Clim_evmTU48s201